MLSTHHLLFLLLTVGASAPLVTASYSMRFTEQNGDFENHYCVEKKATHNPNFPYRLDGWCSPTPEGNEILPFIVPVLDRGSYDTRESNGCNSRTNPIGKGQCDYITTIKHRCSTGSGYEFDIYNCNEYKVFTLPNTVPSLRGNKQDGPDDYWTTNWVGYRCNNGNIRWDRMETEGYQWTYSNHVEQGRPEWVGSCGVSPTMVTLPTKWSDVATSYQAKFEIDCEMCIYSYFKFTLPNTIKDLGYTGGDPIVTEWLGTACGKDDWGNQRVYWFGMETVGGERWLRSQHGDPTGWFGECGVSPTRATVPDRYHGGGVNYMHIPGGWHRHLRGNYTVGAEGPKQEEKTTK